MVRIASINTFEGTTSTAALARFDVQFFLLYQIDEQEIPAPVLTGDFPLETLCLTYYPMNL